MNGKNRGAGRLPSGRSDDGRDEMSFTEESVRPAEAEGRGGSPLSFWKKLAAGGAALLLCALCFFGGWLAKGASEPYEVRVARWMLETMEKYSLYEPEMDREDWDEALYRMGAAAIQYGICEQGERFAAIYRPSERLELLQSFQGVSQGYGLYLAQTEHEGQIVPYVSKVLGATPVAEAVSLAGGENGLHRYDRPVRLRYERGGQTEEADLSSASLEQIKAAFALVGNSMTLTVDRPVQTERGVVYTGGNLLEFSLTARAYTPCYAEYYTSAEVPALPADAALIALLSFNAPAASDFARCMEKFAQEGKRYLILDLRDNGGGLVAQAESILEHLLDTGNSGGTAFAKEVDKNGKEKYYRTSANYYGRYGFKSVQVLANGGTASASELTLMAMQEFGSVDRVIGTRTYGKGIVQKYYSMDSGFTLKLTVAQIYDMNGRTIHGFEEGGILPDVAVEDGIFLDFAHDASLTCAIEALHTGAFS